MGKTLRAYLLALGLGAAAWALPQDPSPAHGQVHIQTLSPGFMQILQSSPQAILNWNQFNIGPGERVQFLQPGTQAAILNRVTGLDPSLLQGTLQANGRVFLLNPNGILFGPGSVVDVGSFTASTLKMSDEDFLSGNYRLTQDAALPLTAITNQGEIRVADGGFVVLVSPLLDNQGLIVARSGTVQLGASTQASFSVDGRGQVLFAMPDGFQPHFSGGGQGGTVLLQPGQMSSILSQVVSNQGLVEAGSFASGPGGQTLARGAEGVLVNSGTIQADRGIVRLDSSQASVLTSAGLIQAAQGDARLLSDGSTLSLGSINAQGGFAEVSGERLGLYGPVSAATVLLDPNFIDIINGPATSGTLDGDILLGNPPSVDGSVSTGAIAAVANLILQADLDIRYTRTTTPDLIATGTTLTLLAGRDILLDPAGSNIELATLSLVAGNDIRISNGGQIRLGTGPLNMAADNDIVISSLNSLTFATPSSVLLDAGRDLNISLPAGFTFDVAATSTVLSAGRNFSLRSDRLAQSAGHTMHIDALGNVDIRGNPSSNLSYNVGGLNVTAAGTLTGHADGAFVLNTNPGDLRFVSDGALSLDSSNSALRLSSSLGTTSLQGSSVSLNSGGALLNVQGTNGLSVASTNGNLQVGTADLGFLLSGSGPVTLQSTGGNISYVGPSNLDLRGGGPTNVISANNLTIQTGTGSILALGGSPTTLQAARDVDLRVSAVTGGTRPINVNAGQNVTITPGAGSNLDFSQTQSLGVTAVNDIVINVPGSLSITTGANQVLQAGRNLTVTSGAGQVYNAGGTIDWRGGVVNVTSGSTQDWRGPNGISLTSTTGDLSLLNSGAGDLSLDSSNANVNVASARDVAISAPSQVLVRSNPTFGVTSINATNDVRMTAGTFQPLNFSGRNAKVKSGNDILLTANQIRGDNASGTSLNLDAGRNLTLTNPNSTTGMIFTSPSVNATAGNDLTVQGGPAGLLVSAAGDLRLQGDRNLALTTGGSLQVDSSAALLLQGGNLTTQDGLGTVLRGTNSATVTATSGNLNLRTNGNALQVSSSGGPTTITSGGNISLVEPNNLVLGGTAVSVTAPNGNVDLGTGPGFAFTPSGPMLVSAGGNLTYTGDSLASLSPVNLRSTSGNVTLQSLPGRSLSVSTGGLNVTSGNDLLARSASGNLNLASSAGTDIGLAAARNLTVQAPLGAVSIQAAGGNVVMTGQNVTVQAQDSSAIKSALGIGTTMTLTATAGDLDLQLTGAGSAFDLGADGGATLSATGRLAIRSGGTGTTIGAANGNVSLQGEAGIDASGAVLTVNGRGTRILTGSNTSFAPGSVVTATATGVAGNSSRDLDLTDLRLNVTGGNVTVNADRNLRVGNLVFPGAANATLTGGNITVRSMQDLRPGNLTITTPGNLTETVAATAPVPLAGLNITAGRIHNLNNTADNVSFSIPSTVNPADLHVTVTGGNDTVVPSAANLRNFGGNVQPVVFPSQTGDVYVDGLLRQAGQAPVTPPPPVSAVPDSPVVAPQQPLLSISPDERSRILAQSNLALGNLGSFARTLGRAEHDRLTIRTDALYSPWNQDSFSPTLALILPGGPPLVSSQEALELETLLGLDVAAAVNTMLAQELGFIWEVRYWRHLTERFVIWEDKE